MTLVIYDSNKVTVQGNIFTPEIYGKINLCLDNKIENSVLLVF
jgi:hypothetical protein